MAVFSILLAAAAQATSQCAGDAVTRPLIFIIQADNDRDLASVMNFFCSSDPVFLSPTKPPLLQPAFMNNALYPNRIHIHAHAMPVV